jgi:hypothetical protein
MISQAFKGHGTFIYSPVETLRRYGNDASRLADGIASMQMSHAWVRMFGAREVPDRNLTRRIIAACRSRGIEVAGWGWLKGHSPKADAKQAADFLTDYGLSAFVADIEDLGEGAESLDLADWNEERCRAFFSEFRDLTQNRIGIALSTNGFPSTKRRQAIVRGAHPFADIMAPQVYWFNHPDQNIKGQAEAVLGPRSGQLHDNIFFLDLCLDMWKRFTSVPILLTGQAYWDATESRSFNQAAAEAKLSNFLARFGRWQEIVGLNWWHLGHGSLDALDSATGAMSPAMIGAIRGARLQKRPYMPVGADDTSRPAVFLHREVAEAMSQPSNFFRTLAGIPVHYDRPPLAPYGSDGVTYDFHAVKACELSAGALVKEIRDKAPASFGALELVLSAGAWVDKPGEHGRGNAFDLDGIKWKNQTLMAKERPTKTVLYIAVQALCHKHFGTVLDFNYNVDHQDHLHIDLGQDVGFRKTKSTTLFIQASVNVIYQENVGLDGEYGPMTDAALKRVLTKVAIGDIGVEANWLAFLDRVSADAFGIAGQQHELMGNILIG